MRRRYVVATQRPWGRATFDQVVRDGETWACLHFEPEDPMETDDAGRLSALLAEVDPRYAFFLNWSARVPRDLLARYECVNFHCTALPYGRGGHPIENLLLAGHTETVMTAHRMVEEVDAGPVYWRFGPVSLVRLVPEPQDPLARDLPPGYGQAYVWATKDEILARFVRPCASLIRTIVEREPAPEPQDGQVVRFSRLSPEAYKAFWEKREAGR